MIVRIGLLYLMLVLTSQATAQVSTLLQVEERDSWVESFKNKLALDLSLNNHFRSFETKTPDTRILIYPNASTKLRLNLNYDFLSLGVQWGPDFLPGNGDEALKGETRSFRLGTSLAFDHVFGELSYARVRGHYLRNSSDFIPDWHKGDPYVQFPGLNYEGVSLTAGYSFNPNFSIKSLTTQTERQLRSAGSFMPVFQADYFMIGDDTPGSMAQNSRSFEFSLGPGYTYTYVYRKRFYASLGLFANLGYLNTELITRMNNFEVTSTQNNLILRADANLGLGYNDPNFYTAVFARLSDAEYNQENTTAHNSERRFYLHFVVGARLGAPKFLETTFSKINRLL